MNVTIVQSPLPRPVLERFSIRIDIDDADQLRALVAAAGKMCNGHGLQLYGLLKSRLDAYERMLPLCGYGCSTEDSKP